MKKFIALTLALLSLSSFAGGYDRLELVRVKGATASQAYSKAQSIANQVNDAKWSTKLSFLRTCNPTAGDFDDGNFRRKAHTSTSMVSLNHVTGMYTGIVKVRCED